jgi:hypothetical protein
MQSNTASVGNQSISFASFSVENRRSDPVTVVDGRYVGHDLFRSEEALDDLRQHRLDG